MVTVEKGQSVRIETQKQVIEIRDFAGLGVCTLRYFVHPALEFAAYRPPYWAKGQGNRAVFKFYLDVPAVTVDEEQYLGISYFALRIGGDSYMADVSGSTGPAGDDRVRQYAREYIFLMRRVGGHRWSGFFDRPSLTRLLQALGHGGAPRRDDFLAAKAAQDYAAEQARLAEERERNIPLGLVHAAVGCPDGRTFVWTTRGNYYLPPGVYKREWQAGLVPGQNMTIAALRARGIECIPTDEERPESVYGRRAAAFRPQ